MKYLFILLLPTFLFANDRTAIDACLDAWGKHPFSKNSPYRKIKSNVKVMGIGGNVEDDKHTSKPELVLVKHSVAVMSKQKYELMNPNGWYCLKGAVAVLGKSEVRLHCKAHFASSNDGAAVAASADEGGVAVLGKVEIKRICD